MNNRTFSYEDALALYELGVPIKQIAREMFVTPSAISRALNTLPEYQPRQAMSDEERLRRHAESQRRRRAYWRARRESVFG